MCVNNKAGEVLVVEVKEKVSSKDLKMCAVLRLTRKKTSPQKNIKETACERVSLCLKTETFSTNLNLLSFKNFCNTSSNALFKCMAGLMILIE